MDSLETFGEIPGFSAQKAGAASAVRLAALDQLSASPPPVGLLGFPLPPCGDPPTRQSPDLEQGSPETLSSLGLSWLPPGAQARTSLLDTAG